MVGVQVPPVTLTTTNVCALLACVTLKGNAERLLSVTESLTHTVFSVVATLELVKEHFRHVGARAVWTSVLL